MKMLTRKFLFASTISLAMASCTSTSDYKYKLDQDPSSDYIVSLDSIAAPDTRMIQFADSGDPRSELFTFAMLNAETQSINIHNAKGNKVKEIILTSINPALPTTSGFYFIDKDSLLIFSYKQDEMRLLSVANKFKPKLIFNLDSLSSPTTSTLDVDVNTNSPIIYHNGTIYLTGRAMLSNEISTPQSKRITTAMSFNIHTGKENFYTMFPSVWGERYWHFEQYYLTHAFVPEFNSIAYSAVMKDSIVLYNFEKNSQINVPVASDKLGNEKDMVPKEIKDPRTLGSKEDLEMYLDKPHYGEIIFDKYRHVFYRFITTGSKKRTTNVIIHEVMGKKIGEVQLPSNYMSGAGSFITKQGLYLRKSNTLDENKIVFTLFKLSKHG
ncbi:MAG: DUF4221 family protein [Janthinobacterium sp.]|jgi:hypothetical protein